jgi:hypothetical protein
MKSQVMSEPTKPNEQSKHLRAVPRTVLALTLVVIAWFWLTRQPAQVNADILQGLVLAGMGWLGASLIGGLIGDLRGKETMEMLATAGYWSAALFASLVSGLLLAGLLVIVWHYFG